MLSNPKLDPPLKKISRIPQISLFSLLSSFSFFSLPSCALFRSSITPQGEDAKLPENKTPSGQKFTIEQFVFQRNTVFNSSHRQTRKISYGVTKLYQSWIIFRSQGIYVHVYNIRKWLVFCTCFAMFCQSDQFKLNQPNPDQSRPIQTTPDQSRPIKTNQDQSRPIQTNPDQSRPIQTNPDLSRPIQNYSDQSRPIQTNTCLSSKT